MRNGWKDRWARGFEAVGISAFTLLRYMPWVAAVVIGGFLTWFNVVEQHRPFWPRLALCLGVPLLLAGLLHLLYRDGEGTRTEAGCGCGLIPLLIFLSFWSTFERAYHKAKREHAASERAHAHAPTPTTHG